MRESREQRAQHTLTESYDSNLLRFVIYVYKLHLIWGKNHNLNFINVVVNKYNN